VMNGESGGHGIRGSLQALDSEEPGLSNARRVYPTPVSEEKAVNGAYEMHGARLVWLVRGIITSRGMSTAEKKKNCQCSKVQSTHAFSLLVSYWADDAASSYNKCW
jgi:hypothetical protein